MSNHNHLVLCVNKKKAKDKALNNPQARCLLAELKEFVGSYAIRATRGTTRWSAHS